jgi:hypothetical protein
MNSSYNFLFIFHFLLYLHSSSFIMIIIKKHKKYPKRIINLKKKRIQLVKTTFENQQYQISVKLINPENFLTKFF